ncbi:hypothetical protein [Candidatus Nitrosacidococcus tergens]|uniref:Uncharacterized protein n=1 Tax=Candidatus Nitrosacidococcus tergens TaxID=553981 RepID=A0A7G1QAQ6_9GAMM|nr:hypothetical protein [Candidatus Nitrosacidococcus tergens]CAB1276847.1 conserved protein of unknown function [Candidatus Nitrosacidococcus tergens]
MPLAIDTFHQIQGGQSLVKALGHPLAAQKAHRLLELLAQEKSIVVYDPLNQFQSFVALYKVAQLNIAAILVQKTEAIGQTVLGYVTEPITALPHYPRAALFLAVFDSGVFQWQIQSLLPPKMPLFTLDILRLADQMIANSQQYLDPLNFATNFVLFRESQNLHTRLTTANYWAGYGAKKASLWCILFDESGKSLAQWQTLLSDSVHTITIDSQEVKRRFKLPDFTGSLFIHVINVAGHDVVKYALDIYDDHANIISSTHDANAWPADRYAGLPAPKAGESVILWIQNSQPCPIPAGEIGLNLMGTEEIAWLEQPIAPFATYPLKVADLLPHATWPQQLEIQAGKYFVRPRYEIITDHSRRIAHVNVERVDLVADQQISRSMPWLGKGYILPAPILPISRWKTLVMPTPMATGQQSLPIKLIAYDGLGQVMASHYFGNIPRSQSVAFDLDTLLTETQLPHDYGHLELVYDFEAGMEADGWLHGLFRYEDREHLWGADTSFGSHIFNTVLTYKNEPQSYTGSPPGLTTRLFLRLGRDSTRTFCHLIYPASTPWHPYSHTQVVLHNQKGMEVARKQLTIPCSGSLLWYYDDVFDAQERAAAGAKAYIIVRDATCRLFGYHGLINAQGTQFSLDHMFGF